VEEGCRVSGRNDRWNEWGEWKTMRLRVMNLKDGMKFFPNCQ
jgi:hypothetical protein